jgi:hypothetical protein
MACAVLVCAGSAGAQDSLPNSFLVVKDTLRAVDNGQTFSVDVGIKNSGRSPFAGSFKTITDSALDLISRQEVSFSVDPQKSYYSSVQVRIPLHTASEGEHRVLIELSDSLGNILESANVKVLVNSTRHVELNLLYANLQFSKRGDTVVRAIKLRNLGNTDQVIRLLARVPGSTDRRAGLDKEILLPAFQDSVIDVRVHITKAILAAGHFPISVNALYSDGDLASVGSIDIDALKTKKRLGGKRAIPGTDALRSGSSIEVNGQYLFTNSQSFQVVGGSELKLDANRIIYHVDAQYFTQRESPFYVRNTFVDLRKVDDGILLGNISRNYDISLYGRGAMGYLTDSSRHSYYEAGLMDGNYNLVGIRNYEGSLNSSMAWANYRKAWSRSILQTVAIYDHNRMLNEKDLQVSSEYSFRLDSQNKFDLRLGAANSQSLLSDTSKYSGAVGLRYTGEFRRLYLRSENFLASAYYPGVKRGGRSFDEKINYRWNNISMGIGYTHFEFKPQYLNAENNSGTHIRNDRVQVPVALTLSESFSLSLTPQYFFETNQFSGYSPPLVADIHSLDCGINVNYFGQGGGNKNAYIFSEIGVYRAPLVTGDESIFHYKVSLNARFNWFSLNAYVQGGEFYAADVGSRYFQNEDYTRTIRVSPQITRDFFERRLHTELGFSYNESNVSYKGIQINSRVDYDLTPNTRVYVSIRSYQYESPGVAVNDLRIGFLKGLPQYQVYTQRKILRIFVYRDVNFNNKFDADEEVAKNALVKVNGELLITDMSGYALYKGLPKGEYEISAPSRKGWDAPERLVTINQRTRIELPLRKSSILMGRVTYDESKGIVYEVAQNKEQILVRAVAPNGNEYTTKTDENGGFLFYMPPGQYEVGVAEDEMPDQVQCADCKQTVVLPERGSSEVDFHFRIKEREVNLQKFVSPGRTKGKPD